MKVVWNDKACCHSGNCVKTLPEVFKVENGQFVIQPKTPVQSGFSRLSTPAPPRR